MSKEVDIRTNALSFNKHPLFPSLTRESKMELAGLHSFWCSSRKLVSLLFPASRGHLHALAYSQSIVCSFSPFLPSSFPPSLLPSLPLLFSSSLFHSLPLSSATVVISSLLSLPFWSMQIIISHDNLPISRP